MIEAQELLERMGEMEMLILRATTLILLTLVCAYAIWMHLKPFFEKPKRKKKRKPTPKAVQDKDAK